MPRIRPPKEQQSQPNSDQAATAAYVAALASELAALARRHKLDTVGYLLDMAHLEAQGVAHSGKDEQAIRDAEPLRRAR